MERMALRRSRSRSDSGSASRIQRSRMKKSASKRRLKHNAEAMAKIKSNAIQRTFFSQFRNSESVDAGMGNLRRLNIPQYQTWAWSPVQHVRQGRKNQEGNTREDRVPASCPKKVWSARGGMINFIIWWTKHRHRIGSDDMSQHSCILLSSSALPTCSSTRRADGTHPLCRATRLKPPTRLQSRLESPSCRYTPPWGWSHLWGKFWRTILSIRLSIRTNSMELIGSSTYVQTMDIWWQPCISIRSSRWKQWIVRRNSKCWVLGLLWFSAGSTSQAI